MRLLLFLPSSASSRGAFVSSGTACVAGNMLPLPETGDDMARRGLALLDCVRLWASSGLDGGTLTVRGGRSSTVTGAKLHTQNPPNCFTNIAHTSSLR